MAMKKRTKLADRKLPNYTRGEEIFNMVTHIVGAALGGALLVLFIVFGAIHHSVASILCGIVFGVSLVVLFTISAIYHGLSPKRKAKKVMQILDHCSIFLLIAGSYTPVTICALTKTAPALAWVIFGVVWGISILGIVLNSIDVNKYMSFSMVCYLGLGWCIVISMPFLIRALPVAAIWLLVAGGVAYTVGAILFGLGTKKRYMHSVFHIFVVLGAILHGLMVLLFVI